MNLFDCPKCGLEIDADDSKTHLSKKISFKCLHCGNEIYKRTALRLMEKKDGRRRWSLINCLEDRIDPFTGKKLVEKNVGNGWIELVREEAK